MKMVSSCSCSTLTALIKRCTQALLTTRGAHLTSTVEVPLNGFRQESTTISFVVEVPDPAVSLSLPRWNTNALHAPREGNSLGKIGFLRINGSYQYFSDVRKDHVEQLKLKFTVGHKRDTQLIDLLTSKVFRCKISHSRSWDGLSVTSWFFETITSGHLPTFPRCMSTWKR